MQLFRPILLLIMWCLVSSPPLLAATASGDSLLIGAFNVQVFGDSKSGKPEVMARLVQIIIRYDLLLVQEVRDKDGSAIAQLLKDVNEKSGTGTFKLLLSERLGRTSSKEQYAWFYREERLRPLDANSTAESDPEDIWEREPMLVYWDTRNSASESTSLTTTTAKAVQHTLATIGIHVDPDEAVAEIDALAPIVDATLSQGQAGLGVLVMGDLNADCSYVTKTEWRCIRDESCTDTKMRLWNPDKYVWLLNDTIDTTTSNSHCAYDRLVYTPAKPCSDRYCSSRIFNVGVYDFQAAYGLSQDDAKDVSDHFPVELRMRLDKEEQEARTVESTTSGAAPRLDATINPNVADHRRLTFLVAITAVVIATGLLERSRDLCIIQLYSDE